VREVIVENICATIGERDGKLISWTNEEVISDSLGELLLVLIIIVYILVARVL
jgi:hypothetical protein